MPTLPRHIPTTAALLVLGLLGALIAQGLGLPLPFMIGSLLATAPVAIFASARLPEGYGFPTRFRTPFIGLIGAIIGAQVTPELVSSLHDLIWTMGAIVLFVALAQGINYLIFRRLGGYDRVTAFYSGSPGGLIESILLGEASGADVPTLAAQQFLRIILVIVTVPFALSLWLGEAVGSASGLSFSSVPVTPIMLPLGLFIVVAGLLLGQLSRLPAKQLTGPLMLAAALSLAGVPLALPDWAVLVAQLVVGTSLGMRFAGIKLKTLRRCLWLSVLSVGAMFAIGASLAFALTDIAAQPFDVLMITFAPGGVTEMALVALSLGANPAFVTLHHIFRIILTVLVLSFVGKRLMGKN